MRQMPPMYVMGIVTKIQEYERETSGLIRRLVARFPEGHPNLPFGRRKILVRDNKRNRSVVENDEVPLFVFDYNPRAKMYVADHVTSSYYERHAKSF